MMIIHMTMDRLRTKVLMQAFDAIYTAALETARNDRRKAYDPLSNIDRSQVWRWKRGENAISEGRLMEILNRMRRSDDLGGPSGAETIYKVFKTGPMNVPLWKAFWNNTPEFTSNLLGNVQSLCGISDPWVFDDDEILDIVSELNDPVASLYALAYFIDKFRNELGSQNGWNTNDLVEVVHHIIHVCELNSVGLDSTDVIEALAYTTSDPEDANALFKEVRRIRANRSVAP